MNPFVVFGVNTAEPRFASPPQAQGGLYLGRRRGSRDESRCQIFLKSLQLFSGLTDFTAGMQSKTAFSQTVILRIPAFNAHTRR